MTETRCSKAQVGKRSWWVSVAAAALGCVAGFAVLSPPARACSCAQPSWSIDLQSVTSSDPSVSHADAWLTQGTLQAYEGHADIWATEQTPAGVINYIRADR
jgi:hypothetical protein